MKLLCELFGHWPEVVSLRRHGGRWTCRCWLCQATLVREPGAWCDGQASVARGGRE
jgi:hypothetical protein